MTKTQSTAALMRKRLFDDMDALDTVARAVFEARSARAEAHAALELAQVGFDLAVANEQDLLERSAALRAGTVRLRNSLQTMATFPSELLAMICAEAAFVPWEEPDPTEPIDWDAVRAPYRFATVSRHWRHAALSASRCWTHVVLLLFVPSESAASILQHAELAFQRSRSLLIDVDVAIAWIEVTDATRCLPSEATVDGMFKLLMANLHRIRSLRIRTGTVTFPQAAETAIQYNTMLLPKIVALLRCPTPELVRLDIGCDAADYLDDSVFWQGFPDHSPFLLPNPSKLESLRVSAAPILCARPHALGLPSLRTLVVDSGVPVYDSLLWDTVAMAPQLDVLVVACRTGAESALHPLRLPDTIPITHLKIHTNSVFPSDVACPRLQTFEYASWLLDTYTISESMGRTVTTLRLEDVRFTDDEFDAMRSLRAVEHASVSGYSESWRIDDTQFYILLCDAVDPMWPRLRHLELWRVQSSVNASERNGLLKLVRARNGSHGSESASGPPPLEKLEIDEQSAPGWVAAEVTKVMGTKFVIRASK